MTSQANIPPLANNSDRDYFIHHRSNPSLSMFIGKPVVSRSSDVWIIPVSRRFNDSKGRFAGVVLATIKVDYVKQLITEFEIGRQGALALALWDGTIPVRKPFALANLGKSIAAAAVRELGDERDVHLEEFPGIPQQLAERVGGSVGGGISCGHEQWDMRVDSACSRALPACSWSSLKP